MKAITLTLDPDELDHMVADELQRCYVDAITHLELMLGRLQELGARWSPGL